jgi:hypothetical protein
MLTETLLCACMQRYNLLTPEWAKRKFARDEEGGGPGCLGALQHAPAMVSPLGREARAGEGEQPGGQPGGQRGSVARRLNIEQVGLALPRVDRLIRATFRPCMRRH